MNKSDQINELAAALSKAQAEMQNPHFDSNNPFFKSKYASLAAVRNAVIPVLAKYGLSVIQQVRAGRDTVVTDVNVAGCVNVLLHSSGQWIETDLFMVPVSKNDAQGACAGATYARRASLQALACVVGDADDDGEQAVGRGGDAAQGKPEGYKPKYQKATKDPLPPAEDPAATLDGSKAAPADPATESARVAADSLRRLETASSVDAIEAVVKGITLIASKLTDPDKVKLREAVAAARLRVAAKPYVPPASLSAQLMAELEPLKSQLGPGMFGALVTKHMGDEAAKEYGLGSDGLRNLRDDALRAIHGAKA